MSTAFKDGFITGMSIEIIVGQLGTLFGVEQADSNTIQKLWSVISQIGEWRWTVTVIGVDALLLIFAMQRFLPKLPSTKQDTLSNEICCRIAITI